MPTRAERQAQAAHRRAQVVQARIAGVSFEEIGRRLGISDTRACQLYQDALKRTYKGPTDEHRQLEILKLDRLALAAENVLRATHYVVQGGEIIRDTTQGSEGRPLVDHAPVLNAIRTLLAVQERRAKLLGLDAPTKIDVNLALAWERATDEERLAVLAIVGPDLFEQHIAQLQAELDRRGPPTPPAAETIPPPGGEPDPAALAAAVEAALDAAGVPPEQREAAYQAVEQRLREREP